MERSTVVSIMAAILAAPRKGDYEPRVIARLAGELYDAVQTVANPLVGGDDEAPYGRCKKCGWRISEQESRTGGYHIGGCP